MTTHFSPLAWRILLTEEPGGLQSIGSQRVRHSEVTEHTCMTLTTTGWICESFHSSFTTNLWGSVIPFYGWGNRDSKRLISLRTDD